MRILSSSARVSRAIFLTTEKFPTATPPPSYKQMKIHTSPEMSSSGKARRNVNISFVRTESKTNGTVHYICFYVVYCCGPDDVSYQLHTRMDFFLQVFQHIPTKRGARCSPDGQQHRCSSDILFTLSLQRTRMFCLSFDRKAKVPRKWETLYLLERENE